MTREEASRLLMETKRLIAQDHPSMVMNEHRANLYGMIQRTGGITTSEIHGRDCVSSVQSISTTLKNMHYEGWLDRDQVTQESGGVEWVYYISINKPKQVVDKPKRKRKLKKS